LGVRGIPSAGKNQTLNVPHQQHCGFCSLGLADASGSMGLVIWSCSGPACGLGPCHPYDLQVGKSKLEKERKELRGESNCLVCFIFSAFSPEFFLFWGKSEVRD